MSLKRIIIENKVEGGLADNKKLSDIAKMHDVSVKSIMKQLLMGIEIEMEHTNDSLIAHEIAMDHLYEDPNYYSKLKTIENH